MSNTHHNGQRLFECNCGQTIRLKPEGVEMSSPLICGGCGERHDRGKVEP